MTRDHNKVTQNLPIHSCWTLFEKFHTDTWSWTSRKSWWEMLANTCLAAQTGFWVALSTWVVKLRLHLQQREKSNFHHLFSPLHYISEGRVSKPKRFVIKVSFAKKPFLSAIWRKAPTKNCSSKINTYITISHMELHEYSFDGVFAKVVSHLFLTFCLSKVNYSWHSKW